VWKGIGVPPSYGQLFGGVVEAVGVLGVLLVWVNRLRVRGLKPEVITRMAVGLVGTFVVSTVLYLFLFQLCVIDHPEYGSFYFPLWPTGELAWMIRETGGRFEAIHRYGLFPVERAILNTPAALITATTVVLLVIYQAIFTSLAVCFAIVGIGGERHRPNHRG
jgi:hypothetical protein